MRGSGPDAASPQPGDCTLESTIDDDLNEGPTDYGLNRRPTGDVNVILLFVDFPDATSTDGTNAIADLLSPRIEDYYNEVSYGQLSVHVNAVRPKQTRGLGPSFSARVTTHR